MLGGSSDERLFAQHDGSRPAGCSRSGYLQTWGKAWEDRHPGATKRGRARLLTREAFDRYAPSEKPSPKASPPVLDDERAVLDELGLRRRAAS